MFFMAEEMVCICVCVLTVVPGHVESHAVPQRCSRDREGGCELRHTDRGMADRQTGASLSAHTD